MPQDPDRRQDERAPIELKVEYQRLNTFFYDYTRNISKGGTFIKTDKPLGVGTLFLFRLYIPTLAEPLELRGEVRWIRREGDPPPAGDPDGPTEGGMGIRFVFDNKRQRVSVDKTVEKLMVASLGQRIYAGLRNIPSKS